jgi:hypothetical protein
MNYGVLLIVHIFAAIFFVGTVFFEVLILENVRKHVPREAMRAVERGIGTVARRVMPWVILLLFAAGLGMAYHHRAALAHPLASSFAFMLTVKIVLAFSVLGHFLAAMWLMHTGKMRASVSQRIHLSVFIHVVLIVFLAKAMFYLQW